MRRKSGGAPSLARLCFCAKGGMTTTSGRKMLCNRYDFSRAEERHICGSLPLPSHSILPSDRMETNPASVASQKFAEEQPQILRLILALFAPKFAQDDSSVVMQPQAHDSRGSDDLRRHQIFHGLAPPDQPCLRAFDQHLGVSRSQSFRLESLSKEFENNVADNRGYRGDLEIRESENIRDRPGQPVLPSQA